MKHLINILCWIAGGIAWLNFSGVLLWYVVGLADRSMLETASWHVALGVILTAYWFAFYLFCAAGRHVAAHYTIVRRT